MIRIKKKNSKDILVENIFLAVIGMILFINMLIPSIYPVKAALPFIIYPGWTNLLSGLILVVSSITTLSRHGTEDLVTEGIYRIVRHPLYVGAAVMFLSHMFFFQHWFFMLDSFLAVGMIYQIILWEEKRLTMKFPKKYADYSRNVPRINFIVGLWRRYFHPSQF